ncbi:MAG: sugar ABC transporter substrate-binding protein [Ignavibacteriales bacterium]|nr:sugar ABC transporter substrate-binding protein [Ignavibacteriales bacterium]
MSNHFLVKTAIVLTLLDGGCGERRPTQEKFTIGFAINTLNNPFFVDMKKGAEDAANRSGVDLIVQATEREMDVERQMQIVENFIESNVRGLCLTPNGTSGVIPAILKANKAGIPIIIVDSRVNGSELRAARGSIAGFVGSDNVEGGRLAGEYVVRRLSGKGAVAVLEGPAGHETGDSRLKGFRMAIEREPGIILASSQIAGFDRSQGYIVFQNILEGQRNLRAVFACNDLMALGAVEAISALGKTGKIVVVGFDAIDEAKSAIRDGRMDATIAQYPYEMGRVAVESVARVLNGEQIPPEIPTRIELITKENVDR